MRSLASALQARLFTYHSGPYKARFPALRTQRKENCLRTYCTQRRVQNWAHKRDRTCSNLTQATEEVANSIAGICDMIQDNGEKCLLSKTDAFL